MSPYTVQQSHWSIQMSCDTRLDS